jgi:hypothetical protein
MATLTKIVTGMEKGPEAIDANDTALNADIATLTKNQNLTWYDVPLESGITGALKAAVDQNQFVYVKGEIIGNFTTGMKISSSIGTPLANMPWGDLPVVCNSCIGNLQTNGSGVLSIQQLTSAAHQIDVTGFFSKA